MVVTLRSDNMNCEVSVSSCMKFVNGDPHFILKELVLQPPLARFGAGSFRTMFVLAPN